MARTAGGKRDNRASVTTKVARARVREDEKGAAKVIGFAPFPLSVSQIEEGKKGLCFDYFWRYLFSGQRANLFEATRRQLAGGTGRQFRCCCCCCNRC